VTLAKHPADASIVASAGIRAAINGEAYTPLAFAA
jgi:hypothetical protein